MNIRIESNHNNLKEIHQLIYQGDPDIIIDEDYKSTPGTQSEPIVIALISAATPIVVASIRAWVKDRKSKREAELEKSRLEVEREKIKMAFELERTKLILIENNKKIIEITAEEIEELDKYLLTQGDGQSKSL